jgi:hypothetical protein
MVGELSVAETTGAADAGRVGEAVPLAVPPHPASTNGTATRGRTRREVRTAR